MRLARLKHALTGTLRRQLVFGMVAVVGGMMALSVWDMTRRQQAVALEQQTDHALALARSVSTSAAVWVASRDYSGLQEIIGGLARYPDLQHAIVLDAKGQVLAHNEASRRGLYLNDLPRRPEMAMLGRDAALVDVAYPIFLGGSHVGWVRIGLGQESMAKDMATITRNGIVYALIALALAAVLATLAARRLTRRLYAIQAVADAVEAGQHTLRADVRGVDEAARLARGFNDMLDSLEKHSVALGQANAALRNEIDQRHAAEEARDRMIAVVEASPDFISMARPDATVLFVNRGGWRMIGADPEHPPEGMRIADVYPQWATDLIRDEGIPAAVRDGSWVGETALRHVRDGSEIPVSQVILAHRDPKGELLFLSTVMRDISERKRAERALEELNEALEQRVLQRTEDLRAAMEEAERASRAKSDFLSSMSHELRTPMNAILGFSQIMEYDEALPEEHRDSVQEILKAGRHLLGLINEVLDLSKIESGHVDLSIEPVYVLPLVQECQAMVSPLAHERGIRIERGSLQALQVRADRTRLKQALLNLLSNAIKYNRAGGTVQIRAQAVGDERLRINVTDTGPGIPPGRVAELFEPFHRLDARQNEIEGSGIGLTITRRLVEMMGGQVEAESRVGVGSTFWIELPVESASTEYAPQSAAGEAAPSSAVEPAQHIVLYIEDNPSNLKLVAQILGHRPHIHLLTAHTPELGIELARSRKPDLILLDINMPGLDGYQVLEILKTDAMVSQVPVVAVTDNAMPRDVARGRAAGFADYLTKPIDVGGFFKVLDVNLHDRMEKQA